MGIVELQGESSNLLLKKTNHGLVLSHNSLKCADLALHLIKLGMEINNELISGHSHKKAQKAQNFFLCFCAFLWLLLDLLDQSQGMVAGDERDVFVRAEVIEQFEELARIRQRVSF